MLQILVIYGTTDGQTRKIAEAIGATIRAEGCRVAVLDAATVAPQVQPTDYDGVIVAASIQMGGYQRPVRRWVQQHAAALNSRPGAFVSVCLGVLERRDEAQREVRRILQSFLDASGWHPAMTRTVAGALRYSRYGWFKRWMMKRIVRKAGGDTDTSRDYEYTNWEDVRAFARVFADRCAVAQPAGGIE
jgi:menaquinone-dependent protoporphyrinogen oxidase